MDVVGLGTNRGTGRFLSFINLGADLYFNKVFDGEWLPAKWSVVTFAEIRVWRL